MDNQDQYKPIFYQHRKPYNEIHKFTIIGERHSGTNWLERILTLRLSVPLTWEYGWKHFYNYSPSKLASGENTLFVCITRNIYDWIGAFFKLPHHVDRSIAYDLDKFLLSEWKSQVEDNDYLTNKPYKNIFELRKCKLQFFNLFLPLIVDNMIVTRYEDLLVDPEQIVSFLSNEFHINKTNNKHDVLTQPHIKHPYYLSKNTLDIINQYADWDTENKFGYHKNIS